MTTANPGLKRRHALGLPPGSIRAAHVLGVVGIFCAILLVPGREDATLPKHVPPYLIYLLFVMLGHFFAAHGVSIATRDDPQPSPLHLPGGTVRFLVILALGGTIGWKLYSDHDGLVQQYQASLEQITKQPLMPVLILGGYLLGVLIRSLIGWRNPPVAWQEFEAWISVIALVGIVADGILRIIVVPTLIDPLSVPLWEGILGTIVAFYFGERT
jgi:hypothetical protein